MATFTIRNDSETFTSSVTSVTFSNHPSIYHLADLSSIGGPSSVLGNLVVLPVPYTLAPLSTVTFTIIYDLNTLVPGTYQGTVTVYIGLSTNINIVDGGAPDTSSFPDTVDGGITTTITFDDQIDGENVLSTSQIITTTQLLTATNNVTLVSTTGAPQYIETPYNTPYVYSTGTFVDGYSPLGPISANSGGDPSGSLPGNFE